MPKTTLTPCGLQRIVGNSIVFLNLDGSPIPDYFDGALFIPSKPDEATDESAQIPADKDKGKLDG